jgi:hypothetical protein
MVENSMRATQTGRLSNEITFMSKLTSRAICLASRPSGIPTAANFELVWTASEPLKDREVLVRNLYMSVDPYMRGRMNEGKSYVPPFEIGKPLEGGAVGDVIESRAPEFKPGDGRSPRDRLCTTGGLRGWFAMLSSSLPRQSLC